MIFMSIGKWKWSNDPNYERMTVCLLLQNQQVGVVVMMCLIVMWIELTGIWCQGENRWWADKNDDSMFDVSNHLGKKKITHFQPQAHPIQAWNETLQAPPPQYLAWKHNKTKQNNGCKIKVHIKVWNFNMIRERPTINFISLLQQH